MATFLATFGPSKFFYIFTKIGDYKIFLVGILRFQKYFDFDILDFQIEV
jgi:hypothetical protein